MKYRRILFIPLLLLVFLFFANYLDMPAIYALWVALLCTGIGLLLDCILFLLTEQSKLKHTLQAAYNQLEKMNIQLQAKEEHLQQTLKNLSDIQFSLGASTILAITDERGVITHVNDKFCEISKYEKSELIGKTHRIINSKYHNPSFFADMWKTIQAGEVWRGEIQNQAKDGQYYWVDTTIIPFLNKEGKPYQYVSIRHDITSQKETEQELKRMNEQLQALVQIDGLTGIGNRRFFDAELNRYWNQAVCDSTPLSFILLDVDQFKLFNDYYGHQTGDECLKQVAAAIRTSLFRSGNICARYGGEEFVVLLPNTDKAGALQIAQRIRLSIEALHIPHQQSQVSGYVTSSLGVSTMLPNHIDHPKALVAAADKALYQSKRDGRNRATFFTTWEAMQYEASKGKQEMEVSIPSIVGEYLASLHAFDQETWGHSNRVAHYAAQIAVEIGLSADESQHVYTAGLLHDIGKMSIPLSILNKPGRLTQEEYTIIKEHPVISYEKLNRHAEMKQKHELLAGVLHHHERWDGRGYPHGLSGTSIPLSARILAVADAFDAMTNHRIYKQGMPIDRALDEMERNKGIQFDPEIVDVFSALLGITEKAIERAR